MKIRGHCFKTDLENNMELTSVATSAAHGSCNGTSTLLINLLILVTIWYFSSIVAISTSKQTMIIVQMPFTLCFCQFSVSYITSGLYLTLSGNIREVTRNESWLIKTSAIFFAMGFIFTNFAFSFVSASFVETIKASEPISSVLLSYIILKEENIFFTYASLVLVCVGVTVSCIGDDQFHIFGFLCATLSNICFSARAVLIKKLYLNSEPLTSSSESAPLDEIWLYYHLCRIGLVILFPLAFLVEWSNTLVEYVDFTRRAFSRSSFSLKFSVASSTSNQLIILLLVNGIFFACYNLVSYFVLSRTALITHAVLNVFRRVFVIIFTAIYFNIRLTILNFVGISLAVIGILLFSWFKSRHAKLKVLKS